MNFYYNSCFCVSQVSSTDPFGSRISKSVFCSVFEILIPLSGLILYLVLQLGAGVARLAWDNEAQSPCRCCPCLTASQLGLKALQFGLLRNVLGPLKWFCTETLKISQCSTGTPLGCFIKTGICQWSCALVQFTPHLVFCSCRMSHLIFRTVLYSGQFSSCQLCKMHLAKTKYKCQSRHVHPWTGLRLIYRSFLQSHFDTL